MRRRLRVNFFVYSRRKLLGTLKYLWNVRMLQNTDDDPIRSSNGVLFVALKELNERKSVKPSGKNTSE